MAVTAEDDRALEYRRMMRARAAHNAANERRLRAPNSSLRMLIKKWEPVILRLRERTDPAGEREDGRC